MKISKDKFHSQVPEKGEQELQRSMPLKRRAYEETCMYLTISATEVTDIQMVFA
jgi:hypothetical protein